jgi:hypothetical protein
MTICQVSPLGSKDRCRNRRFVVGGLWAVLAAASISAQAVEPPSPGRIPLYAKLHPSFEIPMGEKAPIDPRGKPLFHPTENGPGFGHHWVRVSDKIEF